VLAAHLAGAGAAVGELAWRMPLTEGYRDALESDIADIRHCSDASRQPDACHAAAFLRSFVGDVPWAHLDIAGVESTDTASDRHPAGPTGWGVRLLDRLIADRFEDAHRT
jgi:leucyl aminopeptidase